MIQRTTRILILATLTLTTLAGAATAQSLWKPDGPNANLIADTVARRPGDLLTIIISESQKVNDKQNVKLEKDSSLDSALTSFNIKPNMFNTLPDAKQSSSREFEGKADYKKEGTFEARITVTVVDVMPNGNLVLKGRRNIFMDDEEKTIQITGVVRALDVSSDNTVESARVAEARISYDGKGELSRTTEKGWLDRALDFIWPF